MTTPTTPPVLVPDPLKPGPYKDAILVNGVELEWDTAKGTCTFRGIPVALMWVDSTLAGLMAGVAAMVGPERFSLALQSQGRTSVESDWLLISSFPDFREGFAALNLNAAVAGWGDWQLVVYDADKQKCVFRAFNNWEGLYQKALGVCWGSGMLAGKFSGICSKLFKTNCWATQTSFVAKGDEFDEFEVVPSLRSVEHEIEQLLNSDAATRADMAVALERLRETEKALRLDIAERKRAEDERLRLETRLQQAQKMESVGRLAGGVAHDFNNMLGVIAGHVEMALEQVDPGSALHTDLEEIRKAARRSTDLTRQLLAFARQQTIAPRVIDVNDAVTGMLAMLQRLISEGVHLKWRPGTDLWLVKVDPSQIDQIMANLCVNARDAIGDVGTVVIETENKALDADACASFIGAAPGDYVRLAVSDDGCGMDKKTLAHLFEPFFTTKPLGKGTGLGLATVYGIVQQNGGFIDVYSEPRLGTTFSIYLPRHVGPAKREAPSVSSPVGGTETILLVEDERAILRMTTRMLNLLGYAVVAANSPAQALRLARVHTGRIDLLLTDVVMPEMNGRDLSKALQAVFPTLKTLYMSGYTADVIAHHGALEEGVNFFQKPFTKVELAARLRTVFGSQSRA